MAARGLSPALSHSGDAPKAHALAKELRRTYPTNTFLNVYWLPTINAALAVGKGDSSQALLDLEPAAPYELGNQGFVNYLYSAYVRGQAFLLAHNGTAAAAEFHKLLVHRGIVLNFVTGSLAHLQIMSGLPFLNLCIAGIIDIHTDVNTMKTLRRSVSDG